VNVQDTYSIEANVIAKISAYGSSDGIADALAAGLTPDHFANPTNKALVIALEANHKAGGDGDPFTVATRLKSSKVITQEQLETVCGIVNDGTVTQNGLRDFIRDLVSASNANRKAELEHEASLLLQDGDGAEARELLAQADQLGNGGDARATLQRRKFDPANLAEPSAPILTAKGRPLITPGNVLTLMAPDKAGKTHVLISMARAIMEGGKHLGLESGLRGRCAYIDLEQERSDFESLIIHQGLAESDLAAYHLAGYTPSAARKALRAILSNERNLAAVLIDGFADLIADVNDSEESNALVSELMSLAESSQLGIIGVLHSNPGNEEKSRGHLGSQLGRKSQTVLQIKINGDTRTLFTQKARKRPLPESEGIRFEWCNGARCFVEIEGTPGDVKQAQKAEELTRILQDVQAATGMLAWKHGELVGEIEQAARVKDRAARNKITAMLEAGILKHNGTKGIYTSTLEDGTE
jgi:hypothetical protein